jgi:hypothetical protein
MLNNLPGYSTLAKSLSGIITISDGGGTTISEGDITCNNIVAQNDITCNNLVAQNNITVTNIDISGELNGTPMTSIMGLFGITQQLYEAFGGLSTSELIPTFNYTTQETNFNQKSKFNYDVTMIGKEYLKSPNLTDTDANFQTKNYLQLSIGKNDNTTVSNAVVGIDFTTNENRTGASSRIYAKSSSNSSDLIFATAPNTSLSTGSTERIRILGNGNVGIGISNPTVQVDIASTCRAAKFITNSFDALTATGDTLFGANKTTGAFKICNASTFSGQVVIGDNVNKANSNHLWGSTYVNGATVHLTATTGSLIGTWTSPTPSNGDNSTKIATTQWVTNNTVNLTNGLSKSNEETYTTYPYVNAVSTGTTGLLFGKVAMSANGEIAYTYNGANLYRSNTSGQSWVLEHTAIAAISSLCCSYTGQFVYYTTSGTNKPQYSQNFGQTFSAITQTSTAGSTHRIYCSYDGSIVLFLYTASVSARWTPYYNLSYGATATWVVCVTPTVNASTVNSGCIDGDSGTLFSITLACGNSTYNDFIYYSSTPTTSWTQKLTSSIWSSLSYQDNGTIWAGNNLGLGIYKSVDNGLSYVQLVNTNGQYVSDVDSSWDDTQVVYCSTNVSNSGFYYSPDAGVTFNQRSAVFMNYVTTSQSCKTTLIVPSVVLDTIYTHATNQNILANCDFFIPKNRMTLISNREYDYNDIVDIYFPHRTMFLGLSSTNIATLTFPLYEHYVCYPTGSVTINLPKINDDSVGLVITLSKLTAQTMNFVCNTTDLIYDYGVHTGVSSLLLGTTVTSVTLRTSFGVTTTNQYVWIVTSKP